MPNPIRQAMPTVKKIMMDNMTPEGGQMRNLMGAFTGQGMTFDNRNTQTGLGPGESIQVGGGGVTVTGQDGGGSFNPATGDFDVNRKFSDKFKAGISGRAPVNAATPAEAQVYFEMGGPDQDIMSTSPEQSVERAVDGYLGVDNQDASKRINTSPAQDYLADQLRSLKPGMREGIF